MRTSKNGFTLIELLAVIVILAVLLAIAVPMVSGFIFDSKRSAYIDSLKLYIDDIRNRVNVGEYAFTDPNVTYYVHFNNLDVEKAKKSPFADWQDGYVVVTFDEMTYDYYVTSVDQKGYKVFITEENQLVKESVFKDDDLTLSVGRGIGNRDKVIVYDEDGASNEMDPVFEYSPEEAEQCFNYKVENDQVTILKYKDSCSKNVIIPSKIDGYPVTTLGASSFSGLKITSVQFPNTLVTIQDEAFRNNLISELNFPDSLRSIYAGAFSFNRLTELPDLWMVTYLASGVFTGNLFSEEDAYLYKRNADGTYDYSTITGYAGTEKNLVIPKEKNGVQLKTIGERAFRAYKLDSVIIPEGVEKIESYAFYACGLKSVSLPSTLKILEGAAFRGNNLTSIDIPDSVVKLSGNVFNNNLLPDDQAFIYKRTESGIDYSTIVSYGGANKNVVIPATKNGVSLKTITGYAFYASQLTSVVIPDSVTLIGEGAFNTNLLPDDQAFIYKRTESGVDYSTLIGYGGASTSVIIPAKKNGVQLTTIDRNAFNYNQMIDVTIPEGVTTIKAGAFAHSNFLREITIPSTVEVIEARALSKNTIPLLNTIINKTGKEFNWTSITEGSGNNTFVTGTITHPYGSIEVKSS